MIEIFPTLDELWVEYANDEESLRQRIPFPEWVRQRARRIELEKSGCWPPTYPVFRDKP
jgi:hypothetical protein